MGTTKYPFLNAADAVRSRFVTELTSLRSDLFLFKQPHDGVR